MLQALDQDVVSKVRVDRFTDWLEGEIQQERRYTIPGITCPAIDRLVTNVDLCMGLLKNVRLNEDALDEVAQRLSSMYRSLEGLRTANETLRIRGKSWKNVSEEALKKAKDL